MREQRKLAAVLAADVVGYSRLMGRDEAGTLARLKEHRAQRLEPALIRNGGRLVKLTGDGALAEFGSAVDALRAAIEFQQAVDQANATLPEDLRIVFRVGLHVGDLIVDGDDLYGDGVNIAARLEGEAPPGGIVVSGALHEATAGKLQAQFVNLGQLSLKNIERKVHAFRIKTEGEQEAPGAATVASQALYDKPSIAVLAFLNRSSDPEQEYFSDGISEDIITNLSKFRSFRVIGRNTSFAVKGNAADVAALGRDLKVQYLVEGTVRAAGSRVRITAQLTDVATGSALWAERYDRELKDVFEVQDEITARIATAVDPAIRSDQTERALGKHPADLKAWDHLLRGLWYVNRFRKESNAEARREFEAGIACDPRFAPAHAWLGMTHAFEASFNWTDKHAVYLERASACAAEAVRIDDTEPMAHASLAVAFFWTGRMAQARHAAERAIALNPNSFLGNFICGGASNYSGLCEAAVLHSLKALDLSPNDPLAWHCLGSLAHTHLNLDQFDEAVKCADRAIVQRHGYLFGRLIKVAALGHAGRLSEARAAVDALLDVAPNFSITLIDHYPFVLQAQKSHLIRGLTLAGLPTASAGTEEEPSAPALPLPDKPSIAVLPFQNMSGDLEQEYFADGMVEDIITALSRNRGLFVIARNSTFTYKGKAVDVRQVGRDLGVRYVLEGSVRKAANRVRITGQLIDAQSGAHLWADRFDGGLEDVFELQDQVTSSVVGTIGPTIERAEIDRSSGKPADVLQAYDLYLRALAHSYKTTKEANEASLRLFKQVTEIDPNFARAFVMTAMIYGVRRIMTWTTDVAAETTLAEEAVRRALQLDPRDPFVLARAGSVLAYVLRRLDESAALLDRAVELDPNDAFAWSNSGLAYLWLGKAEEAVEKFRHALRLNPIDPLVGVTHTGLAWAYCYLRKFSEAEAWANKALHELPNFGGALRSLIAIQGLSGRSEDARGTLGKYMKLDPVARVSTMQDRVFLGVNQEYLDITLEGFRLAGMPE